MGGPRALPPREPPVVVLRRLGDPFEAELAEGNPRVGEPVHEGVLNRVFYDSTVDIGGLVQIEGRVYICTRAGWRVHREEV